MIELDGGFEMFARPSQSEGRILEDLFANGTWNRPNAQAQPASLSSNGSRSSKSCGQRRSPLFSFPVRDLRCERTRDNAVSNGTHCIEYKVGAANRIRSRRVKALHSLLAEITMTQGQMIYHRLTEKLGMRFRPTWSSQKRYCALLKLD